MMDGGGSMVRRITSPEELGTIDLDDLILRLINVGVPGSSLTQTVNLDEVALLCDHAKSVFMAQPSLLEVKAPMKICGDIHGQYADVLRIFDKAGFPPNSNYLFLGDYVDRGRQNLEVIILFLAYKIKYSENFFLLRGNHECPSINRVYGFYEECMRRYQSQRIWITFQDVFSTMPFAGLIGERILCMHGGLSPKLKSLEQLRQIIRPIDPPDPSLHMDILWSDPDTTISGWHPSQRGVSYVFGTDVVIEATKTLDIDLVARAHQVVQDGYEFFANKKLVTIFSAPHYCGQFDNAAAIMTVDKNLICSFVVLKPTNKMLRCEKSKK